MESPTARSFQKWSTLTVTQSHQQLAIDSEAYEKYADGLISVANYKVAIVWKSLL